MPLRLEKARPGPSRCARMLLAGVLLGAAGAVSAADPSPFAELLDRSKNERKGLVFYVGGHAIPGVVVRLIDAGTVEVRNQQYDRIIIRLDRVDAVAGN